MDALNKLPGEWFFQPFVGKFYFQLFLFLGKTISLSEITRVFDISDLNSFFLIFSTRGLSAATFLLSREKKVFSLNDILRVLLMRFLQWVICSMNHIKPYRLDGSLKISQNWSIDGLHLSTVTSLEMNFRALIDWESIFTIHSSIFSSRYQPIVLSAVAFETILPLIGSGPIYNRITQKLSENCANGFWLNILHISNLPSPPEMVLKKSMELNLSKLLIVFSSVSFQDGRSPLNFSFF